MDSLDLGCVASIDLALVHGLELFSQLLIIAQLGGNFVEQISIVAVAVALCLHRAILEPFRLPHLILYFVATARTRS